MWSIRKVNTKTGSRGGVDRMRRTGRAEPSNRKYRGGRAWRMQRDNLKTGSEDRDSRMSRMRSGPRIPGSGFRTARM